MISLWYAYCVPSILRRASRAAGGGDRHGKANPDKELFIGWVQDPDDDADHLSLAVEQRSARVARIDRCVDLDQAFDRSESLPSAWKERLKPEITPALSEPYSPNGLPTA